MYAVTHTVTGGAACAWLLDCMAFGPRQLQQGSTKAAPGTACTLNSLQLLSMGCCSPCMLDTAAVGQHTRLSTSASWFCGRGGRRGEAHPAKHQRIHFWEWAERVA